MPFSHLILCRPLLLLSSIFPSIRVFSNESVLCIRWPKYWSFSFSISPSNEYLGLISLGLTGLIFLQSKGTLKSLLQRHSSKVSTLRCSAFFIVYLSHPYMTTGKTRSDSLQYSYSIQNTAVIECSINNLSEGTSIHYWLVLPFLASLPLCPVTSPQNKWILASKTASGGNPNYDNGVGQSLLVISKSLGNRKIFLSVLPSSPLPLLPFALAPLPTPATLPSSKKGLKAL